MITCNLAIDPTLTLHYDTAQFQDNLQPTRRCLIDHQMANTNPKPTYTCNEKMLAKWDILGSSIKEIKRQLS